MSNDERSSRPVCTRRSVLGFAASSAAAMGIVPLSQTSARTIVKSRSTKRIAIIGGGFCGLTAARELKRNGHDVTVFEARDRLGGRTFTSQFAGRTVDLGGTWIHWQQPHLWAEIQRYGVELEETPGATAKRFVYLDAAGTRCEASVAEQWPKIEKAVSDLFDGGYPTMPRPALPFGDRKWIDADTFSVRSKLDELDMPDEIRPIVDALIMTWGNAPGAQVSWIDMMRWYALAGYSLTVANDAVSRFRIVGGTNTLLQAIGKDSQADIRLSAPISSVRETDSLVEVIAASGEMHVADAVICTVPLNTLTDINFSPPICIKKKEESLRRHAGSGFKVHILLDGVFDNVTCLAPGDNAPISAIIWEGTEKGKTHVIAFGPSAAVFDMNDITAIQNEVRKFFPNAKVLETRAHDWNGDHFSKGTWFVSRPGQASSALKELQASQGRILFASADWASGWRGFIDGAIEQGIVAARGIRER